MPGPTELIGSLVELVGQVLNASALRIGVGPTIAALGILLIFLQLVARPTTRWTTRDLGGLAGVGRAMAIAAEAGSAAAVSLGTAGIARSTGALARLQTLGALPLLAHVARAAARSGVALRVTVNDPVVEIAAARVIDEAHVRTASEERRGRAEVVFGGEGRPSAAGLALADRGGSAASLVAGSLGEEGLLLAHGTADGAAWASVGTADGSQATSVLLEGDGTMIGPQLFLAPADLRPAIDERIVAQAANRLIGVVLLVLVIASLLAASGLVDVRPFLLGSE